MTAGPWTLMWLKEASIAVLSCRQLSGEMAPYSRGNRIIARKSNDLTSACYLNTPHNYAEVVAICRVQTC